MAVNLRTQVVAASNHPAKPLKWADIANLYSKLQTCYNKPVLLGLKGSGAALWWEH